MRCLKIICVAGMLAAAMISPASALEYSFNGAQSVTFGKPTSVETATVIGGQSENVNRSKDSAYVPPAFGSPSMDTPGTGAPLTPNIAGVPPMQIGSMSSVSSMGNSGMSSAGTGSTGSGGALVTMPPPSQPSSQPPSQPSSSPSTSASPSVGFTSVADMKYSDGKIGTLKIPAIGVNIKVFDGETLANMKKGAGHFSSTSCWNGNVAMAAHNRGTNNYFGKIHTLDTGDKITYTTKLGTRTYQVYSVYRIGETDTSCLNATSDNILTLLTCVRDVPELRWCVRAKEI